MALDKQVLPVNLGLGIDTKTDPKLIVNGKLQALTNGVFQQAGGSSGKKISKRYGYAALASRSSGNNLEGYNNEIVAVDNSNLLSYSVGQGSWVTKGALAPTTLSITQAIRNDFNTYISDHCINGNYKAIVYRTSQGGGNNKYDIIDTTTGNHIVSGALLNSENSLILKVLAVGQYFVFFYYDASFHLNYKTIDIGAPTVLSNVGNIATDLNNTNPVFDVTIINSQAAIVWYTSGSSIKINSLSTSLILGTTFTLATSTSASNGLTVWGDSSNRAWIGWASSTTLFGAIVSSSFNANVLGKTTLATASNIINITGQTTSNTGTYYYDIVTGGLSSITLSNVYQPLVYNAISSVTLTTAGVVGTPAVLIYGKTLAGKAFTYNSIYYFLIGYPSNEQSTYFLIDQTATMVAKISPTLGGPQNIFFTLPNAVLISSGIYEYSYLIKEFVSPAGLSAANIVGFSSILSQSQFITYTGISIARITFTSSALPKIQLAQNLVLGGARVETYDGMTVNEQGFNLYPEGLVTSVHSPGGGIGLGTSTATVNQVQYIAVYEWMDNLGQINKSGVSPTATVAITNGSTVTFTGDVQSGSNLILSVSSFSNLVIGQTLNNANISAGTYIVAMDQSNSFITMSVSATGTAVGTSINTKDTNSITVQVPNLTLTEKSNVRIVLFRTANNGTIFYRVSSPQSAPNNTKSSLVTSITDTTADAQLITQEQLYTTGGELPNDSLPSISAMCSYKSRIIFKSPENGYAYGYTKQIIPGVPIEFSNSFYQNIDQQGGPLVAPAQLDDKLILFKANSIYFTAGDGPSPDGQNNDWALPQIIASDTGCNNPASIVLTPVGLMYQSPKGIYLIDRSLQNKYIGADVEFYNSVTVTSAKLLFQFNQVRFTLSTGVALIYDYYYEQWSVFTNINAVDSCIINTQSLDNRFSYITPSGAVYYENFSSFTDNGSFVSLSLTTSWLNLGGVQGFQRVWKVNILGDWKSSHNLRVSCSYDFATSPAQGIDIDVTSSVVPYQFDIHLNKQKCEAVQLTISDYQVSGYGEGMDLASLTFEAGIKKGIDKVPIANTYG